MVNLKDHTGTFRILPGSEAIILVLSERLPMYNRDPIRLGNGEVSRINKINYEEV